MKRRYRCLLLVLSGFVLCTAVQAQIKTPEEIKQQLQGKKYYEGRAIIEDYLKAEMKKPQSEDALKALRSQRKKVNRLLHDAESHLNAAGEVENGSKRIFEYLNSSNYRSAAPMSIAGNWDFTGPTSVADGIGRINRIAFDPTNSQKIWAGSAGGGLFVTTTGGLAWSNVGSFIPSLGISGIVVSHANANTIYILTGDGDSHSNRGFAFSFGYIRWSVGVLRSTDGGNSWHKVGDFPGLAGEQYSGLRLVQDPTNAAILLAATSHGLFRTTDGGATWVRSNLVGTDETMVYDIEFRPGSSTTVYASHRRDGAATNGVVSVSGDGGQSFLTTPTYSPNSFTNVERIELAITPADPAMVYLVAGPGSKAGNSFRGVWRSTDNGVTFSRMSNSPNILGAPDASSDDQNLLDLAIAVSPTSANTVLTGGLVVFRSTAGGVLFSQATQYFGSPNIHPDVHDLAFNPLDGKLYAATDGGVAVSSDNGVGWTRRFTGLTCTQFYHFSMQDDDGDIWGGAQDNGVLIKNGNASSFSEYATGDGYDVLTDMAPAGNQDDKWYVINTKVYGDGTIDEDVSPSQIDHDDNANFFPNLAMSPTDEDVLYAGYPRLYISFNRGSDWNDVSAGSGNFVAGNWCLASCPSNNTRLYSAGRRGNFRGIWRIDYVGSAIPDEVTSLSGALQNAGWDGTQKITDIAVHPSNSNRIWVTVGGFLAGAKVFYSSNGGADFSNISNGLPNLPVNCALADGGGDVYIGTDIGVYYRHRDNVDWTPFYNDLPRVPVSELEFSMVGGTATAIFAATYGRGIWSSLLYTDCPASLTVNQGLQGQQFYQAGTTLTTTSLVNGTAGTVVNMKAGTEVNLTPGFEAHTGTEFRAYIQGCNNGVPLRTIAESNSTGQQQKRLKTGKSIKKKTGD